jgi:translation initiation factor IF-3
LLRRPFFRPPPKDTTRINEHIRAYEIRVIDHDGKQLGVLTVPQALEKARERGLDLVEVSGAANPPVCRIMDYGKYKYEVSKKQKASKAKQHIIKVKEIKFHPKTGENDYNYRLEQAKEFLEKGFKVKATVTFRGREMAHLEYGARWLKRMTADLEGLGLPEGGNTQEGRNVTIIFAPLKGAVQKEKDKVKKAEESGKSEPQAAAAVSSSIENKRTDGGVGQPTSVIA